MKKKYISPLLEVVKMKAMSQLLAGSEMPAVVSTEEFVPEEMPTLGREFDGFDDYDTTIDEEDW